VEWKVYIIMFDYSLSASLLAASVYIISLLLE